MTNNMIQHPRIMQSILDETYVDIDTFMELDELQYCFVQENEIFDMPVGYAFIHIALNLGCKLFQIDNNLTHEVENFKTAKNFFSAYSSQDCIAHKSINQNFQAQLLQKEGRFKRTQNQEILKLISEIKNILNDYNFAIVDN